MLASKTGATIIPIGIRGSGKVLPSKSCRFSLDEKVEIHIGKPIDSSQYGNNRSQLMKDVEDAIRVLVFEGD